VFNKKKLSIETWIIKKIILKKYYFVLYYKKRFICLWNKCILQKKCVFIVFLLVLTSIHKLNRTIFQTLLVRSIWFWCIINTLYNVVHITYIIHHNILYYWKISNYKYQITNHFQHLTRLNNKTCSYENNIEE